MWARAPAFLLTAVSCNRFSVGNKIGSSSCVPSPILSLGSAALPITVEEPSSCGAAFTEWSCRRLGLVLGGRLRNRVLLGWPGSLGWRERGGFLR